MGIVKTESHSSNIRTIEHHPAESKLTIEFRNGGRYEYAGVSADDHKALIAAESHGKHVHARIKGRFPFTKVA
jgi:hypothetical protein